uniref:Uncharacterized protein n=1 Tax=Arundo donax TaxID=35708 RepID=A0A0A9CSJ3_ARUDO
MKTTAGPCDDAAAGLRPPPARDATGLRNLTGHHRPFAQSVSNLRIGLCGAQLRGRCGSPAVAPVLETESGEPGGMLRLPQDKPGGEVRLPQGELDGALPTAGSSSAVHRSADGDLQSGACGTGRRRRTAGGSTRASDSASSMLAYSRNGQLGFRRTHMDSEKQRGRKQRARFSVCRQGIIIVVKGLSEHSESPNKRRKTV